MRQYPLLLAPAVKDYLWGGRRLISEFGYEGGAKAAEAWVMSCHRDGPSVVVSGEERGKTLPDVLTRWGSSALGEKAAAFPYFPLLIKLIDAHDRLSVQVHPDDEYAGKHEGGCGKTEMWYVVDCEPGAHLIYGLREKLSKEEFRRCIEEGTLPAVCNCVPVRPGDVFLIEAGTLHAIGKGILIAEVQQNSNTTYRVSDYGRLGADGKPRPLHIDKAVDVVTREPPLQPYGAVGAAESIEGGAVRRLAACRYFSVRLLRVTGSLPVGRGESFESIVCLEGRGALQWDGGALALRKGASVFLPAGLPARAAVRPGESALLLCSRI